MRGILNLNVKVTVRSPCLPNKNFGAHTLSPPSFFRGISTGDHLLPKTGTCRF